MKLTYNLGQILTPEECEDLALEIMQDQNRGVLKLETDYRYYKNSYGGTTLSSWDMLRRFTPMVQEVLGRPVTPANPYCRIYNNESTLVEHVDRQGLDWTASICLFSNIQHDWPLLVRVGNNEIMSFPIEVGSACLVRGGALPHWREPLSCDEDQYVIMMFLHWSDDPL